MGIELIRNDQIKKPSLKVEESFLRLSTSIKNQIPDLRTEKGKKGLRAMALSGDFMPKYIEDERGKSDGCYYIICGSTVQSLFSLLPHLTLVSFLNLVWVYEIGLVLISRQPKPKVCITRMYFFKNTFLF